ncbi:MAG: DUF1540 domain-containing protein [Actinomycetota bacterium]
MATTLEMPRVQTCTATLCAYNTSETCHAFAILVGDHGHAHCDTFFDGGAKGGIADVIAQVGACQKADCVHNVGLECQASAIAVGAHDDGSDCLTYEPR